MLVNVQVCRVRGSWSTQVGPRTPDSDVSALPYVGALLKSRQFPRSREYREADQGKECSLPTASAEPAPPKIVRLWSPDRPNGVGRSWPMLLAAQHTVWPAIPCQTATLASWVEGPTLKGLASQQCSSPTVEVMLVQRQPKLYRGGMRPNHSSCP